VSKGQSSKKGQKKAPAKTLMEKRAAKREKKNGPAIQGFLEQTKP
jgi:hypothetical protein